MRVAAAIVLFHPTAADLVVLAGTVGSWNHGPLLIHCNEDPDGATRGAVAAAVPIAVVSSSAGNRGFSGGNNDLVEQAFSDGCDAVLIHNPDLLLAGGAVSALCDAATELARPALLGPALELAVPVTLEPVGLVDTLGIVWTRSSRHFDADQGKPWSAPGGPPREVAGISGACLFVTKSTYERVVALTGEFLDEAFIAYREDAELGFRAALVGIPSFVVPGATGRHARSVRGTSRGTSAHIDRLGVRNRFLMAAKYGRHRPGGLTGPLGRDGVVLAGVLLRERASWSGVVEAWHLRHEMRRKGRVVLAAASLTSKQAARL